MTSKPLVCIDFDGVLNDYEGWRGPNYMYRPRPGVKEFLEKLGENYTIGIFSTRVPSRLREWFELYHLPYDKIVTKKLPALAYIDDRALKFEGDYNKILYELERFKAHWEKDYTPSEDESSHIREQLEIAIATERTELGRSVLRQFQEQIS